MKWLLGAILQVENLILEVLLANLIASKSVRVTVSQCQDINMYHDFLDCILSMVCANKVIM